MSVTVKSVFLVFDLFLPVFLESLFIILVSIFLYFFGQEKEREFPDARYLKFGLILNFIAIIFLFLIPSPYSMTTPISSKDRIIFYGLAIVRSLIFTLSRLISLGLIILIIGYNHREQLGDYLMISGLSWLIFFIFQAILLPLPEYSGGLLPSLLYPDIINWCESVLFYPIYGVTNLFNSLGVIFLIVHAYKTNNQNLKLAGFIYVIMGSMISLGYIPFYIEHICT